MKNIVMYPEMASHVTLPKHMKVSRTTLSDSVCTSNNPTALILLQSLMFRLSALHLADETKMEVKYLEKEIILFLWFRLSLSLLAQPVISFHKCVISSLSPLHPLNTQHWSFPTCIQALQGKRQKYCQQF